MNGQLVQQELGSTPHAFIGAQASARSMSELSELPELRFDSLDRFLGTFNARRSAEQLLCACKYVVVHQALHGFLQHGTTGANRGGATLDVANADDLGLLEGLDGCFVALEVLVQDGVVGSL